eukprot:9032-Pelagococcus_subviridis.AAC.4
MIPASREVLLHRHRALDASLLRAQDEHGALLPRLAVVKDARVHLVRDVFRAEGEEHSGGVRLGRSLPRRHLRGPSRRLVVRHVRVRLHRGGEREEVVHRPRRRGLPPVHHASGAHCTDDMSIASQLLSCICTVVHLHGRVVNRPRDARDATRRGGTPVRARTRRRTPHALESAFTRSSARLSHDAPRGSHRARARPSVVVSTESDAYRPPGLPSRAPTANRPARVRSSAAPRREARSRGGAGGATRGR